MSVTFSVVVLCLALAGYYHWYIQVVTPLLSVTSSNDSDVLCSTEVTVVVCVKNEAKNIVQLIASLKQQTYANFKVVIIDDDSQDNTFSLATQAIGNDNRFVIHRLIETKKRFQAKKGVVDFAYQLVSTPWILHIDADCIPSSNNWISSMMQKTVNPQIQLVLGLGFFKPASNWWQHLIQGETILIAAQYIGTTLYGKPYMAVGRNMAVHKSIYKRVKFDDKLLSGDDDLLIQQFGKEDNATVQIAPDARTLSNYPTSLKTYLKIKKRHVSTANSYSISDKFKLIIWPLGLASTWLGLLFDSQYFTFVFGMLLFLRVLFQNKISKVIYGRTFIGFLLIVESYLLIQSLIVYIANHIRPTQKWN